MIISHTFKSLALASAVALTPAAALLTVSAPAMAQQSLDLSQVNLATIRARQALYNDEANTAFQKAVADGTGITFAELAEIRNKDLSEAEKKIVRIADQMNTLILKLNTVDGQKFLGVMAGINAGASSALVWSSSVDDFQSSLQQILNNSDISDDAIAMVMQFASTNYENDGNAAIAINNLVNKYPVKTTESKSSGGNVLEQEEQQADPLPPLGEVNIDLTNVNVDTMFTRQIAKTFEGAQALNPNAPVQNNELTPDEDTVALVSQHIINALNNSGSSDFEGSAKGVLDQINVPDEVAAKILEYLLSGPVELERNDTGKKRTALANLLASYKKKTTDAVIPPPAPPASAPPLVPGPPPSSGGGGGGSDYGN